MYHDGFLDRFGHSLLRLCRVHDLLDAADEILNEADLAHILTLQHTELLGHIIRVHIAVTGDEQTAAVGAHERKVAAPFIFDPDGVQIFRLRADHNHDLGRVQGGEDVRLVFLPKFVLQRDAREEDLIARVGELVVNILRQRGILCPFAVLIGFFVADEHVKRRFFLRDRQNVFLQVGNTQRFFFVQAPCHAVGIFECGLIIHVVQNTVKARAVAGRDALAGSRILHILDAVPAEQQVPVRLSICIVLADQPLVDRRSLVKLTVAPQMRAAVEQAQPLVVVRLRQRHRAAAVFARSKRLVRRDFDVPAAHFAFNDRHLLILLSLSVGEFDVFPAGDVALTRLVIVYRNHGSICFQANCMKVPGINGDNIRPIRDVALVIVIIAYSNHGSVCFQTDCVAIPCTDGHNVGPVRNVALAIIAPSNSHYGSICFQPDCAESPCVDGYNIGPIGNVTFVILIRTDCNYGSVRLQSKRAPRPCADGHNICPIGNIAFAFQVLAHGHYGSV